MKTKILLLLAGLFLGYQGQGQTNGNYYQHLVGSLNDQDVLTLELVHARDSLYGTMLFSVAGKDGPAASSVLLAPIQLKGKITSDGQVILTGLFDETPIIKGRLLQSKQLQGTLTLPGGKAQPFLLYERYPSGSVPLNVYHIKDEKGITPARKTPSGKIAMTLVVTGESGNPVLSDTVHRLICSTFDEDCSPGQDPGRILAEARDKFFQDYFASNEDIYRTAPDAGALNWLLMKSVRIISNDQGYLSFSVYNYAYTGGAHGLETEDFFVVNLQTGHLVSLEDIFKPGFDEALTILLNKKLIKMKGLTPNQKLTDAGFFVDEIKITDNFYRTPTGIGFYYATYDIAPYVNGPTEIFLSYKELSTLLK